MEFGEKLKRAREEKGMTQQTLADQLFVTRQAVSRWECGARFPDLLTAKKISEILEVSLDELLSGEDSVKFIEENPIVTSTAVSTIQAGLYGFSGMAFLVFSIVWIVVITMDFDQYDLEIIPQVISKVCSDFSMTILMLMGFAFAVKGKLTPKKTAILPILYSILKILSILATNYYVFTQFGLKINVMIIVLLEIVFYVLNILFIIGYFLKNRETYRYFIYLSFSMILVNQVVMFIQKLQARGIEYFSYFDFTLDMISILGVSAFAGLVIYQTYALHKKRCQAANTSVSNFIKS